MEEEKERKYTRREFIYLLLKEELGCIEPYGDTEIDTIHSNNVDNYEYIINSLLEDIDENINKACDMRYSEQQLKNKLIKYLEELKKYITDILDAQKEIPEEK